MFQDKIFPSLPDISEGCASVYGLTKAYGEPVSDTRDEAGKFAVLRHDVLRTIDEHGHKLGAWFCLEDEARYSPLEVAHLKLMVLVHKAFREDVYPTVVPAWVPRRRGKQISAICCEVGIDKQRFWLAQEGRGEWLGRQQLHGLVHGRLEQSTARRMEVSMCWKNLAEAEKGGKKPAVDLERF